LGWLSPVAASDIAAVDRAGKPLARIKSLQSERTLLGLLSHRRNPGEFRLEEPAVHVVLRPDGSNWEDALAAYLQPASGESAVDKVQLKVVGGTLEVQDQAGLNQWRIEGLDVDLLMSQIDETWIQMRLAGHVRAAGTPPGQVSAEFACQAASGEGQTLGAGRLVWQVENLPLSPWATVLQRVGVDIQMQGQLSARGDCQWDPGLANPRLRLEQATGQQIAVRSPQWLGNDTLSTSMLELRGQIDQSGGRWRMENVVLLSDFARLQARGSLPPLTGGSSVAWADLIRDLQKEDVQISGDLQVAPFATMLPQTLRIRPTTRITSGNVHFSLASQNAGQPSFSASLEAGSLAAVENGRPFSWDKPLKATADFRYTTDGPVIDQLRIDSEFLTLTASGRVQEGSATLNADLDVLAVELARFVDLGDFRIAGGLDGQFRWQQAATEQLNASGQIKMSDFHLSAPKMLPWREQQLLIDVAATADAPQGKVTRIPSAWFRLTSARDQLSAKLTRPVDKPSPDASWPLELQIDGRLETWLPRVQPFVDLRGWAAKGSIDLDAAATVDRQRVAAETFRLVLGDLRAENSELGLFVDEPTVRLETRGAWDLAANRLVSDDTTLTSSTVAFRAQQVQLQLPGEKAAVSGTVSYRADLGRLTRCLQQPGQTGTTRLSGSATGVVRASHEDDVTALDWNSDVQDLVYATLPAAPAGTPVRPVSLSGSWQEVWREASVRLAGRERYDHAGDMLHVDELTAATATLKLSAQGKIEQLSTRATADLSGTLDYDLADVTKNLQASMGNQVRLAGREQAQFQVRGPLVAATASAGTIGGPVVPPELGGSFRAGWQSADVYGMKVGQGDLQGSLSNCLLQLRPLDIPVSEGRVKATPHLELSAMPVRLMLDKGPLIENVRISPEMCQTWLKYVAPLLADATRAEGTFSVTLDRASVPLPDSTTSTAKGVLTIHAARVGPGPLAQEFLGKAQQIRTMIDSNASGQTATWLTIPEQQVQFDVQDGRVQHHGLTVTAGDVVIRTSGSVGFDQTLALLAEVPVQDQWIANKRLLQGLKGTTLQLPLRGSFSRPQVDSRALADLNRQMLRNAAGGALEQELGRGLQQLFGPRP